MFSVNSAGDIILRQELDYEMEDFYSFLVHVTDGRTVSPLILFRYRTMYFSFRGGQRNRILMRIFVMKRENCMTSNLPISTLFHESWMNGPRHEYWLLWYE
jgi:hypothetical protein